MPFYFSPLVTGLFFLLAVSTAGASDQGGVCRDKCVGADYHSSCYPVKDPDGFTGCECTQVQADAPQCERPTPPRKSPNDYSWEE